MAFQPMPATCKVAFEATLNNVPVVSAVYFGSTGANFTSAGLATIASASHTWWTAEMKPLMAASYVLNQIVATALHDVDGPQHVHGVSELGSNPSAAMPGNVAFAVRFNTALTGRSHRGRFYVCGLVENQCTGNNIGVSTADALVDAFLELQVALDGAAGATQVIVSRYHNGALRTPTAAAFVVTSVGYTDLVLDTQRRRLH